MRARNATEQKWRDYWRKERDEARRLAARATARALRGDMTGAEVLWNQLKDAAARAIMCAAFENGHRAGRTGK